MIFFYYNVVWFLVVFLGWGENIIFNNLTTGASNSNEMQNEEMNDANMFPKYSITYFKVEDVCIIYVVMAG